MNDDALSACLDRWEEARRRGEELTPDQLAPDRPDLAARLGPLIDARRNGSASAAEGSASFLTLTANAPSLPAPGDDADRSAARTVLVTPPPLPAAAPPAVPPGYELLGEVGRGGMGVVYKVRQVGLNRVCALKMILAGEHAGEAERVRFGAEAEAIARLHHPNIVAVYEVGSHAGHPYFSLEFCPGGSLDRRLNGTPLEPRQAATLVRALAGGIHAAHQAHVVHRDLKPANVLLAADGTPKVTDFGLARRLDVTGPTQTGAVMGTPPYMPPEQAHGDRAVGPLADVYALGAILYECLTGRPPFRGANTYDTLVQVISQEPVPPAQLNARVPRDLETIALTCLHKDPARRYPSAEALAADLGRFLAGEPIVARRVGRLERAAKWVRRHRAVSALAATAAVFLLAGLAASWVLTGWALTEADASRKAEERARDERGRAEEQRDRAEQLVYASKLALAQNAIAAGDGGLALLYLEECPWNLRGWEHRHLRTRLTSDQTLPVHGGETCTAAWRPDGKKILAAYRHGRVVAWDAATGRESLLWTVPLNSFWLQAAFSPDGLRLVTLEVGRIITEEHKFATTTARVWDVTSGREVFTLKAEAGKEFDWGMFSSDGRRLVLRERRHQDRSILQPDRMRVWDVATGREVFTLSRKPRQGPDEAEPEQKVVVNLAGNYLATSGGWVGDADGSPGTPDAVRVWDVTTGRPLPRLQHPPGERLAQPVIGPNGLLLTNARGGSSRVWDATTGRLLCTLQGSTHGAVFHPDGRRLLIWDPITARMCDATTGNTLFDKNRRDESSARVFAFRSDGGTGVAFSPDGQYVALVDGSGTVQVWDAVTGQVLVELPGSSSVNHVVWSPDGRRLLTSCFDSTMKVWDVTRNAGRHLYRVPEGRVGCVAYSPEGRCLLTVDGGMAGGDGRSPEGSAWIRDVVTGRNRVALKGDVRGVDCAGFSPDGRRLVTWQRLPGEADMKSRSRVARVWDATTGLPLAALPIPADWVGADVLFSPDGGRLLAHTWLSELASEIDDPGRSRGLRVWDAATGQLLFTLKAPLPNFSGTPWFSPDGRLLLFTEMKDTPTERMRQPDAAMGEEAVNEGTYTVRLRVRDTTTWREQYTLTWHPVSGIGFTFSPDGRRLATWESRGLSAEMPGTASVVRMRDAATGRELFTLNSPPDLLWEEAEFSPDGRYLVALARTTAAEIASTRVYDAATGRELFAVQGDIESHCAFSPDSRRLVTRRGDTARVWDVATGRELFALKGHLKDLTDVAFNPDLTRIATGSTDGTVRVWHGGTGQELLAANCSDMQSPSVSWSPDGSQLIIHESESFHKPNNKQVMVLDASRGQTVSPHLVHGNAVVNPLSDKIGIRSVAFSPDGRRLASAGDGGTARVWDATTGRELLVLRGHAGGVRSVAFSPDGRRLASAGDDGTARVWDTRTGQAVLTLKGHTTAVISVAFSPDGRRLVTDSDDGLAKVWDAATGQALLTITGTWQAPMAWSPDGKRLISRDDQGKPLAWSSETGLPVDPGNSSSLPPRALHEGVVRSPNGSLLAERQAGGVRITDLRRLEQENHWPLPDAAERKRYHGEKAAEAEEAKQWFAAAFHLRRLVRDQPDDAVRKRLAAAEANLKAAAKELQELPPARMEYAK